jgi:hypothetical protein
MCRVFVIGSSTGRGRIVDTRYHHRVRSGADIYVEMLLAMAAAVPQRQEDDRMKVASVDPEMTRNEKFRKWRRLKSWMAFFVPLLMRY